MSIVKKNHPEIIASSASFKETLKKLNDVCRNYEYFQSHECKSYDLFRSIYFPTDSPCKTIYSII